MPDETPYNPLDKSRLGESVAKALLTQPVSPLPPQKQFDGAGIYAIYYLGDIPVYAPMAVRNRGEDPQVPIYVGKAVPPGTRKGRVSLDAPAGTVLFRRLFQHARSLEQVTDLDPKDFVCRFLVVEDIWIPLGESLLIRWFEPLWNSHIDGFGIHDPGSGRKAQAPSQWDILHPGRRFVRHMTGTPGQSRDELMQHVAKVLADRYGG